MNKTHLLRVVALTAIGICLTLVTSLGPAFVILESEDSISTRLITRSSGPAWYADKRHRIGADVWGALGVDDLPHHTYFYRVAELAENGIAALPETRIPPTPSEVLYRRYVRYDFGVPFRALYCSGSGTYDLKTYRVQIEEVHNGLLLTTRPNTARHPWDTRVLPVGVSWMPFVANVMLYMGMVGLPWCAFRWIRRRTRAAQGRCVHCGYIVAHSPGERCPECGRPR